MVGFYDKILAFTKGKFMFPPCQPPIQEKQHHKSSVACTSTALKGEQIVTFFLSFCCFGFFVSNYFFACYSDKYSSTAFAIFCLE